MKIIDAHVHVELDPEDQRENIKNFGIDASFAGLFKEMKENKVERAVLISEDEDENAELAKLDIDRDRILMVMYVDPFRTSSSEYMASIENSLKDGIFKGMKLFPGYEYFHPGEDKCRPIFQIAAKYNVPVVIHTGDTSTPGTEHKPKVKYARPHYVDDAAVDFPDTRIVVAHAGDPWVQDAAEVAFKNPNVWLDVSGWFLGKIEKINAEVMRDKLKFLVSFVGPDKLMYGTDWPLIRMKDYIGFVTKNLKVKKQDTEKIMYRNALKVFWNK